MTSFQGEELQLQAFAWFVSLAALIALLTAVVDTDTRGNAT